VAGAANGAARRTELAEFLRSRRERITPEQAGLPPAPRRRTPGLRREEVAQLAGVGVTWYTWLEQGRPINVSTQVLDAIARTLELDPAEHRHLYVLAQVPDVTPAAGDLTALPAALRPILDAMGHMAAVLDERFDLIATNSAFDAVFPSVLAQDRLHRNALWCTFLLPECCHPFVNRHETVQELVATLRGAYARHIGEPHWDGFIRDLIAGSPVFAELWSRKDVAGFGRMQRVFYQPAVGLLRYEMTSFGIDGTPGARMNVFVPADEETRLAEARLRSGEPRHPDVLPCGHTWDEWMRSRTPVGAAA
jgi:transcriptional regulator with XRE-family HTH domain